MKRYILLVVVLLVGCDRISAVSLSPESEFIKSMEGRWAHNNKVANVYYENGSMVLLDDAKNMELLTPSGKLDSGNKSLSVKLSSFTEYESQEMVLYEAAKLVCAEFATLAQLGEMSGNAALAGVFLLSKASDCINGLDKNLLPEKLNKVKKLLQEERHSYLILFNATENPGKVRLGLRAENGEQAAFNFVRMLNPEEKNTEPYAARLASRNAFVDKAMGEIIAKRTKAVPVE